MRERYIALVDDLRSSVSEHSCLEFKKDNIKPQLIGKLCSALSNAARIEGQDFAYVLWGINDTDHIVTGTRFDPDTIKVGNQVFQLWLAQMLKPSIPFLFRPVDHPDGTVIMLEIPAATSAPVLSKGIFILKAQCSVRPGLPVRSYPGAPPPLFVIPMR
ncbi:MAG: ATP-binding protein [Desulfobulbaceae bacterium]|nr:ATP-binding protein [Desulfobulbaceae bacterium]